MKLYVVEIQHYSWNKLDHEWYPISYHALTPQGLNEAKSQEYTYSHKYGKEKTEVKKHYDGSTYNKSTLLESKPTRIREVEHEPIPKSDKNSCATRLHLEWKTATRQNHGKKLHDSSLQKVDLGRDYFGQEISSGSDSILQT
jgi:hypothetical protein